MQFLLPCQLRLASLSFIRITPRRRYHANTLVFSGIFIFQILLLSLMSTWTSGKIKALYIESTKNLPFFVWFQRNLSGPSDSWMASKRMSKVFQDTCLVPSKLLLNETFGGEVPNTLAIVSLLFRTIAYRSGYSTLRVDWPSHLSSQKQISDPSLIQKEPCGKKNFFVAIRPAHKCESLGFQRT